MDTLIPWRLKLFHSYQEECFKQGILCYIMKLSQLGTCTIKVGSSLYTISGSGEESVQNREMKCARREQKRTTLKEWQSACASHGQSRQV